LLRFQCTAFFLSAVVSLALGLRTKRAVVPRLQTKFQLLEMKTAVVALVDHSRRNLHLRNTGFVTLGDPGVLKELFSTA